MGASNHRAHNDTQTWKHTVLCYLITSGVYWMVCYGEVVKHSIVVLQYLSYHEHSVYTDCLNSGNIYCLFPLKTWSLQTYHTYQERPFPKHEHAIWPCVAHLTSSIVSFHQRDPFNRLTSLKLMRLLLCWMETSRTAIQCFSIFLISDDLKCNLVLLWESVFKNEVQTFYSGMQLLYQEYCYL